MKMSESQRDEHALDGSGSRREFIKKAAYAVPAILSVNVALVAARAASHEMEEGGKGGSTPRGQRGSKGTPSRSTRPSRGDE
jgi:hypothetical protein